MDQRSGDNAMTSWEAMPDFLRPNEMPHSLFRDLKLKRRKLFNSASWLSDSESTRSDSAVYVATSLSWRGVGGGGSGGGQTGDDSRSSQDTASATSWSDSGQKQDDAEAERRFEEFTSLVRQDTSGSHRDHVTPRARVPPSSSANAQNSSGAMQPLPAAFNIKQEAPSSDAFSGAAISNSVSVSETAPAASMSSSPAVMTPQVVAFAPMPAPNSNTAPQVMAMVTFPNGENGTTQMVALPLCNWPYDPMMLNRLLSTSASASGHGASAQQAGEKSSPRGQGSSMLGSTMPPAALGTEGQRATQQPNGLKRTFAQAHTLGTQNRMPGSPAGPGPFALAGTDVKNAAAVDMSPNTPRLPANPPTPSPTRPTLSGQHAMTESNRSRPSSQNHQTTDREIRVDNNVTEYFSQQGRGGSAIHPGIAPTAPNRALEPAPFRQQVVVPSSGRQVPDPQPWVHPPSEAAQNDAVVCEICSDKATGLHYGIVTCEGCKGFFKRTVQNKRVYKCVSGGTCEVSKLQRTRCQYCRFKKCLQKGMVLAAVREDRMPGGRNSGALYNMYKVKYKKHKKLPSAERRSSEQRPSKRTLAQHLQMYPAPPGGSCSDPGVPPPSGRVSSLLTDDYSSADDNCAQQRFWFSATRREPEFSHLISELLDCEKLLDFVNYQLPRSHVVDENSQSDTSKILCGLGDRIVCQLVRWMKHLPFYSELPLATHTKILTGRWHEILLLTVAAQPSGDAVVSEPRPTQVPFHTSDSLSLRKDSNGSPGEATSSDSGRASLSPQASNSSGDNSNSSGDNSNSSGDNSNSSGRASSSPQAMSSYDNSNSGDNSNEAPSLTHVNNDFKRKDIFDLGCDRTQEDNRPPPPPPPPLGGTTSQLERNVDMLHSYMTRDLGKRVSREDLAREVGVLVEKITYLNGRFRDLQLSREEYVCLKIILLLNHVKCAEMTQIRALQERYSDALEAFVNMRWRRQRPSRFGELLVLLPLVQSAAALLIEKKMIWVPFLFKTSSVV